MKSTKFTVEIQDDGKLKIDTEEIADSLHINADDLISELEQLMGSKRSTTPKKHPFFKNKKVLRGGKIVKAT